MLDPNRRPACASAPVPSRKPAASTPRSPAAVPKLVEPALSEALVLGLMKQGVRKYFAIFGHARPIWRVLPIYEEEGATRTLNCRNEVEMAHAAPRCAGNAKCPRSSPRSAPGARRWPARLRRPQTARRYHIYGDDDVPARLQHAAGAEGRAGLFGRLTATMGQSYVLHTPEAARCAGRGALCVNHRTAPARSICCCRSTPSRSV